MLAKNTQSGNFNLSFAFQAEQKNSLMYTNNVTLNLQNPCEKVGNPFFANFGTTISQKFGPTNQQMPYFQLVFP